MKHSIALLLAALSLSGCASVYNLSTDPKIYGGTRLDGRLIGSAASNGAVQCGLANCDSPRVWWLASGALCDLPLSILGDTVLLPVTAIETSVATDAQRVASGDRSN